MNTRIPALSPAQPRSADSTQRTQPGSGKQQPLGQRLWPRLALSRWAAVALAAFLGLYANARADSTVVEWGDPNSWNTDVPPDLTNVVAVAAGGGHSLALKDDGTIVAWGDNGVPSGLSNVMAVAAGRNHSFALIGGSPLQGRLGNSFVSGDRFHLTIAGLAGTQYQYILEQSTDLQHWTPTQTNTLPGGGRQWVVPTGTNHQFFRTRTINAPPP